jgi:hypothetical protein
VTPARGATGEAEPARAPRLPLPGLLRRTTYVEAAVYGPVSALLAAAAEIVAHALALPPLPWAIGAGVAAVGCSAAARYAGGPTYVTLWQATAFCSAGAWLGWARFANLSAAAPWLWLAGAAVLLATAYPLITNRQARLIEAGKRYAEQRARLAEQNRWPRLLARIGYPGITMAGREETGSGYVLRLRLPGSGQATISKLRNDLERLEVAADTKRGSLHLGEGETARDVLLYVSTRDYLADTIPYEDNGEPLTIHSPIPIGRYEDGTICALTLREVAVLICGLRGSGKSNLQNVLIAQLVRCLDVLVFVIDTKYRLVMPWVRPYLDDEASGMAVDWAATSRSEAELMLRAFNRGIAARAAAGGGEAEKIEPGPGQPAVFLVIDELASIFGIGTGPKSPMEGTTNTTLAGLGTDAVRLGRSEAMDLIAASQRGTVTMLGSGDFRSQFAVQIGLRVANEADARSVIPDDPHAARVLASLRHEGTGLVRFREGRGMRVKFFRITPEQVAQVARRYGSMKPAPERVLAGALGEEYQSRWERFRETGKAPVQAHAGDAGNATDQQFREITSQLGDIDRIAPVPPPHKRVREFIGRSGQRGVTVTMIVSLLDSERTGVDEQTVRRWLAEDANAGIVEGSGRGIYRLRQS